MSSNIRIIQFNKYIKQPIQENKSKNWVMNGRNNDNYQYIIDRYNGSTTNATIINAYINLFIGNGLDYKRTNTNINEWAKLKKVLNRKELRKLVSDFVIFNECSFLVSKAKDKKSLAGIYHLPNEKVVPSIANEDQEIEFYWYNDNKGWAKPNEAVDYPAFGTSNEVEEVYKLVPYRAGSEYFSLPEYYPALPYCEAEEEIANYYISFIKNGLSFGYIVNIPNGKNLSEEQQDEIEKKIKNGLTGSSNAGRFIMSFNDGTGENTTVEVIQMNDSHKQWEYLTSEARQQIMTGHGVVSPMLFGIKDSTGFGNNADELDTAEEQLIKRKIQPKQREFLEALDDILNAYGINIELFFRPLTEKSTSVSMSSDVCCSDEKKNLDTTIANDLIDLGEEISDEWELIESKVIESETDLHFANTGSARPNAKSSIDGKKFKSRLRYTGEISSNSREFCRKMISANKLYRLEDINSMSNKVVNEGWGAGGSNTYDILLYKGGGACRHYWTRETYKLKADVNNPNAEEITPAKARKEGEILPKLDKKIYQKPNDMPNNGFLNK